MSLTESTDHCAGFWHQVGESPDRRALTDGHRSVAYGELGDLVMAAQDRLRRLAVPDGAPIGLVLDKTPEAVALILACISSMQRFLVLSPQLGQAVRRELLVTSGCPLLLTEHGHEVVTGPGHDPAGSDPDRLLGVELADVSFMLTTSGSTGLPKVVPISDGAVSRFAAWASGYFGIEPGSVVLSYAPLNFDLCFLDVWTTLSVGGTVVLVSEVDSTRGARLAALIADTGTTVVQAVPMCFSILAGVRPVLPLVREVVFTGDAIASGTLQQLPEMFPNARFSNLYGCTETNDSFIHHLDPAELSVPVPIGRPLPGVEVRIVHDDREVVGPGEGELYVSTPFQAAGYLDLERTLDRFVPDPTSTSRATFFRTGDKVRRAGDGTVGLIGRLDRQVKIRGVAVNTAEIEETISQLDGVASVAVVAVPDPVGGRRLVAFLTRSERGEALNSIEVRRHCAALLARAAVPTEIRFESCDLPRTVTGKIDRNALAARIVGAAGTSRKTHDTGADQ